MKNKLLAIILIANVLLLANKVDCQVVLTRQLLEKWYPNGLTNLDSLDLSERQITSIEPNTFSGLTKLLEINFRSNQLTSIGTNKLDSLTNFKFLTKIQIK